MKICSKCKKAKDLGNFYVKSRRGRREVDAICKACSKLYSKDYYTRNYARIKHRRRAFGKLWYSRKWSHFCHRLKRTNKTNDLTKDQFYSLFSPDTKCVYCKFIPDTDKLSVERKDNNVGYIPSNVLMACLDCNKLRGNKFTYEEMKIIGRALREIKLARIDNS